MKLTHDLVQGDERLDMTAADLGYELLDEIAGDSTGVGLWAQAMTGRRGPVRSCAVERNREVFHLPLPAFCRDFLTWSLAGH